MCLSLRSCKSWRELGHCLGQSLGRLMQLTFGVFNRVLPGSFGIPSQQRVVQAVSCVALDSPEWQGGGVFTPLRELLTRVLVSGCLFSVFYEVSTDAQGNSLQNFVETCNNLMFVEFSNKTVGLQELVPGHAPKLQRNPVSKIKKKKEFGDNCCLCQMIPEEKIHVFYTQMFFYVF